LRILYLTDPAMRVAIVTTDARGSLVPVDLPQPVFGTAPEALLQGFASLPEVEVHVLSCVQQQVAAPVKLGPNIFFHSLVVPKTGWLRSGYQGCIRAVRRKVREVQPAIVHGQGTERECAIGAVFSGCPNVITIHGNMRLIARLNRARPLTYQWLAARLERFTIPRTAGVVCITKYTKDAVKPLAKRTWLLPNAVDQRFFAVKPSRSQERTLLCVGNISARKNQVRFIQALDPLSTEHRFSVLFLGTYAEDDPYAAEFLRLVESRPWCVFGGLVNREELGNRMVEAHGLVLPSLEDNCPMVVLEAMAAGLPVAAANVGGVPELVQSERNGFLFNPENDSEIRDAVSRLLAPSAELSGMTSRARIEARQRFHPEVIARNHLPVYEEVLATC
jgi:glycosyltransferase involved in cell wall biosynthesis